MFYSEGLWVSWNGIIYLIYATKHYVKNNEYLLFVYLRMLMISLKSKFAGIVAKSGEKDITK